MNQLYHQRTALYWVRLDRLIKIIVGGLSVAGLVTAYLDPTWSLTGKWVAVVSLMAAIALNILPFGEWAKEHGELFRLWSDLRGDSELEFLKVCETDDLSQVPETSSERLEELVAKKIGLNSGEPAASPRLLAECHQLALRELGYEASQNAAIAAAPPAPSAA